jgi:hypothetical protein
MKKVIIVLSILASALSGARAGIILSDDFTYNDGPIGQPTASGINPSSTWIATSGSGSGKDMDVTNNTLIVTRSRSEDIANLLAGQPYVTNGTPTALYARFTLKCTQLPASTGAYLAHFTGTNVFNAFSGHRCRIWASMTNLVDSSTGPDPALGQFNLGIANTGNGVQDYTASTNYVWPTFFLVTNVSYTIVTRYVLSSGASTLWVNPNSESDPGVTDPNPLPIDVLPGATPSNGLVNISFYGFRQASGEGTHEIDDLRVGTRFADVAGANQSPSISSIQNQAIPRNGTTGPLDFTVSDPETPADELTVRATSGNLTLVPNGSPNIVTNGDAGGTNRTVTITPATGQQGSATITVNVGDGVNTSFTTFNVTVGTPTIADIPDQITPKNTATPTIAFAVSDAEGDTLTLTKSSSNPTLVPPENIVLGVGVPNVSSNVVVTPATDQTGVSTITISANDGHTTTSTSFKVTVTPPPVGPVYNENFAYTSFLDVATYGQALYGANGGSGGPWNHISGPLYELQVTNTGTSGLAYLVGTNNEDLGAAFISSATYDGSLGYVFYTSFTVDFLWAPSYFGDYFFHLSDSGTDTSAFRDKVSGNRVDAATDKFRLGIANQTGSAVAQFPRDLMTNATYAVITRYNAATGDSTLWVNPVNEQSPSVTASDNPGSSTIGGVGLRQSSGIGDPVIGPMKVGTSFSDVWAGAPTRPTLSIVRSGGGVKLSWTDPSGLFVLQTASNVRGPYTDVQDFTNPYTYAADVPQYFRLRY